MLVTHFHEDHIYGLIYLWKNPGKFSSPFFQTFYMPDIFSGKIATPATSIILLEELLSGYYSKRGSCNLCQLCQFLCGNVYHVQLLKRGDKFFSSKYQVLWPDIDYLKPKFEKLFRSLSTGGQKHFQDLFTIAEELSKAILRLTEHGSEDLSPTLADLQNRLETLQASFDWNKKSPSLIPLKDIGDWASIVFHNVDDKSSFLFTGDAEASHIRRMMRLIDIPMHKKYKYIKLPHHGTISHYVDFRKFHPEIFMAPSGMLGSDKLGGKICRQYSSQTVWRPLTAPHMFCSNSGWCEVANKNACTCDHGTLIFSSLVKEIEIK